MNLTAAVGVDRRRLGAARILCRDVDRTGIVDVQLRTVADRSDSHRADIRLRIDCEVLPFEIDVHGGFNIRV